MGNSYLLKIFATISPYIGPAILIIRGGDASAIEKFCYVTVSGPLVIIAIYLRYAEDKKNILEEPDSTARQVQLKEKQVGFRKLLIIVALATCVAASTAAWLLL